MRIETFTGEAIVAYILDLAELRVEVFREWPYLYDGTADYEAQYLTRYVSCPRSLAVLVFDGDRVVGASTAMPLEDEVDDFRGPFEARGLNPSEFFYFGESVLLESYRGQGIGVRFFEEREAQAVRLGFPRTCFCAVERPPEHPARPADYVPLDAFWGRRGYRKHPELNTTFPWKDVGQAEETSKPMTFWLKTL